MEDFDDDEPRKKKKGIRLGGWRTIALCLIIGLIAGGFLEHQYVEPLVSDTAKKLFSSENTNKLLNQEIETCYKQLADYNSQKKQC